MAHLVPVIRPATRSDGPILEEIRKVAFAPVFASFRTILGDDLYELVQSRADEKQSHFLFTLLADDSDWHVYAAELDGVVVGFVSVLLDLDTKVGEIGLNAVHPQYSGKGIGTLMYDYVLTQMKNSGMRAATVSTGGDPSHAPARRAYEKAGFEKRIPSVWMCRLL